VPELLPLAIRPDEWNGPLFLHIVGAMILVGGLLTGTAALALARGDARLERLGAFSLLLVALPGWIMMRAGAEWIYDKEGWTGDDDPAWLGIGYLVADIGFVLLILSLIAGGIGLRRRRRGGGSGFFTATAVLAGIFLVGCVVAIWAMGGKPS
jgi:hypothetical protein